MLRVLCRKGAVLLSRILDRNPAQKSAANPEPTALQGFIPVMPFDVDAGSSHGALACVSKDRLIAADDLSGVENNESDVKACPGLPIKSRAAEVAP